MKIQLSVIFDMDGVIVHNDDFHCRAWQMFCSEHDIRVSYDEVKSWFGNTNSTILQNLFNNRLGPEEIREMASRKESIYRNIYSGEITPVKGLIGFLDELSAGSIPVALATAAPLENVGFVLEKTNTTDYFHIIIDESRVTTGKPSPEIFLKAAEEMKAQPSGCFVFEDSFHGIMAGNNAGMKVIGVATSHSHDKLKGTIMNITDFTEINLAKLRKLIDN